METDGRNAERAVCCHGHIRLTGHERELLAILQSLPGVGRKITAWLFAEASQPLAERDYQVLRTHGGEAPVTKQSGDRESTRLKSSHVRISYAVFCLEKKKRT